MNLIDGNWFTRNFSQTPVGRGYFLSVGLTDGSIAQFYNRRLMTLVKDAIDWQQRAFWARIDGFDGQSVVTAKTIARLFVAQTNRYGVASEETPFIILGPTLNPNFIVSYCSLDLFEAVGFASDWFDDWFPPYWAVVRGPNGNVIIGSRELERMYHAEKRAAGTSITHVLIS